MKIENGNTALATSAVGLPSAPDVDRQKKTSGGRPAGTDQVSVGGGLGLLLSSLNSTGSGDQRVAQLRSLYASGNYKPDPAAISRSLVSSLIAGA